MEKNSEAEHMSRSGRRRAVVGDGPIGIGGGAGNGDAIPECFIIAVMVLQEEVGIPLLPGDGPGAFRRHVGDGFVQERKHLAREFPPAAAWCPYGLESRNTQILGENIEGGDIAIVAGTQP